MFLKTATHDNTKCFETSAVLWGGRDHTCEGVYFRGFIAFEKLKYQARFKVYALKLKSKTKNLDYFSKSCLKMLVSFRQTTSEMASYKKEKVSRKNTKVLRGSRSQMLD